MGDGGGEMSGICPPWIFKTEWKLNKEECMSNISKKNKNTILKITLISLKRNFKQFKYKFAYTFSGCPLSKLAPLPEEKKSL